MEIHDTLSKDETVKKKCIRCSVIQPIHVFEKKKRELNYRNICWTCRTEAAKIGRTLRRRHIEQHGQPTGNCAICKQSSTLVFDHCHKTNAFRGWICRDCNSGIGKMGDNYRSVQVRADYLKSFEAAQILFYMQDIDIMCN